MSCLLFVNLILAVAYLCCSVGRFRLLLLFEFGLCYWFDDFS